MSATNKVTLFQIPNKRSVFVISIVVDTNRNIQKNLSMAANTIPSVLRHVTNIGDLDDLKYETFCADI